jgi:hypothetical protein
MVFLIWLSWGVALVLLPVVFGTRICQDKMVARASVAELQLDGKSSG